MARSPSRAPWLSSPTLLPGSDRPLAVSKNMQATVDKVFQLEHVFYQTFQVAHLLLMLVLTFSAFWYLFKFFSFL